MIALAFLLALAPVTLKGDGIADHSRQEVARATVEVNGEAIGARAPTGMLFAIMCDMQGFWRDLRDMVNADRGPQFNEAEPRKPHECRH